MGNQLHPDQVSHACWGYSLVLLVVFCFLISEKALLLRHLQTDILLLKVFPTQSKPMESKLDETSFSKTRNENYCIIYALSFRWSINWMIISSVTSETCWPKTCGASVIHKENYSPFRKNLVTLYAHTHFFVRIDFYKNIRLKMNV